MINRSCPQCRSESIAVTGSDISWVDRQVGSPFAGRMHPATRAMVGCCVSTLPLRVRIAPGDTVGEFMARVRAAALCAYQNADAGLHTVMAALGRTHNDPLFQVRPQPLLKGTFQWYFAFLVLGCRLG